MRNNTEKKKVPLLMTKKSELTRQRILESASRVIAEEGIEKASLARIARAARTVPSHIAHYFPKKADLFLHVMEYILKTLRDEVLDLLADQSLEERLVQSIRGNYEFFLRHPHYYQCFILSYHYAGIRREFADFQGKNYRENIRSSTRTLKELALKHQRTFLDGELESLAEALVFELEGGLIYCFAIDQGRTRDFIDRHIQGLRMKFSRLFDL